MAELVQDDRGDVVATAADRPVIVVPGEYREKEQRTLDDGRQFNVKEYYMVKTPCTFHVCVNRVQGNVVQYVDKDPISEVHGRWCRT